MGLLAWLGLIIGSVGLIALLFTDVGRWLLDKFHTFYRDFVINSPAPIKWMLFLMMLTLLSFIVSGVFSMFAACQSGAVYTPRDFSGWLTFQSYDIGCSAEELFTAQNISVGECSDAARLVQLNNNYKRKYSSMNNPLGIIGIICTRKNSPTLGLFGINILDPLMFILLSVLFLLVRYRIGQIYGM